MTQGYCDIFPSIPFNGASNFESPQDFDKLSIKVDGKRKYKQLSIAVSFLKEKKIIQEANKINREVLPLHWLIQTFPR
jgi:hypothetical protein